MVTELSVLGWQHLRRGGLVHYADRDGMCQVCRQVLGYPSPWVEDAGCETIREWGGLRAEPGEPDGVYRSRVRAWQRAHAPQVLERIARLGAM